MTTTDTKIKGIAVVAANEPVVGAQAKPLLYPITTMIDDADSGPICLCCGNETYPRDLQDNMCIPCHAHHAELRDALRRALPFVDGTAARRISFQDWDATVTALLADIKRLLGEGDKDGEA